MGKTNDKSLDETMYLQSTPANVERLYSAIKNAEVQNFVEIDLDSPPETSSG